MESIQGEKFDPLPEIVSNIKASLTSSLSSSACNSSDVYTYLSCIVKKFHSSVSVYYSLSESHNIPWQFKLDSYWGSLSPLYFSPAPQCPLMSTPNMHHWCCKILNTNANFMLTTCVPITLCVMYILSSAQLQYVRLRMQVLFLSP